MSYNQKKYKKINLHERAILYQIVFGLRIYLLVKLFSLIKNKIFVMNMRVVIYMNTLYEIFYLLNLFHLQDHHLFIREHNMKK